MTTPGRSFEYEVSSETVNAGRSPDGNQLVIDDAEVSRWHCRFEFSKKSAMRNKCRVVDLQSANGTVVNEKRIDEEEDGVLVRDGDVVSIGMSQIKFVARCDSSARKSKDKGSVREPSKRREPLRAVRQVESVSSSKSSALPAKSRKSDASKSRKSEVSKSRKSGARLSKGGKCLSNIQEIAERRKERREQQRRKHALAQEKRSSLGSDQDLTFVQMVESWRRENSSRANNEKYRKCVFKPSEKIRVCVRKRPMNSSESKRDSDVCTCLSDRSHQQLVIHEPKKRVDLTTYMENHEFDFDQVFDERSSNEEVYLATTYPLLKYVFEGRNATCFAYGQTGSGKTFTMAGDVERGVVGVNQHVAQDLFMLRNSIRSDVLVFGSYFEIYGGQVYDLLNERQLLRVMENGKRKVCVTGMREVGMTSPQDMLMALKEGNSLRATGCTSANDRSSRSHAIFQISLRLPGRYKKQLFGKLSLVDLAGSERGADTAHSDRRTRIEGAQINKSLLALKECIRALSNSKRHKPFRASKLTQVLKDSFVGSSRTVMIATVSPAALNAEHTCNTLRYASRVKDISSNASNASSDVEMVPFSVLRRKFQRATRNESEEEIVASGHVANNEDGEVDVDELHEYDDGADLEVLQRSLDEPHDTPSEEGTSAKETDGSHQSMFEYSMAVSRLVSAESKLVQAHENMLKMQEEVLPEEQELFRVASTGAKGHDSEVYAKRLDELLKRKIHEMERVRSQISSLKDLLRKEEEMAAQERHSK